MTNRVYLLSIASWILVGIFAFNCNKKTEFHIEKLRLWQDEKAPCLQFMVPDGYHSGLEKGIDFKVFFFVPIDTAGLKSKATLGIYVGHHPNRVYPDGREIQVLSSDTVSRYDWRSWIKVNKEDNWVICDALDEELLKGVFPYTDGLGNELELKIHFFINATDEDVARLMIRTAESVELVKSETAWYDSTIE